MPILFGVLAAARESIALTDTIGIFDVPGFERHCLPLRMWAELRREGNVIDACDFPRLGGHLVWPHRQRQTTASTGAGSSAIVRRLFEVRGEWLESNAHGVHSGFIKPTLFSDRCGSMKNDVQGSGRNSPNPWALCFWTK